MKRLGVSMTLGVLVALIVSFVLATVMTRVFVRRRGAATLPAVLGDPLTTAGEWLRDIPDDQLASRVQELQSRLTYPAILMTVNDPHLPPEGEAALATGQPRAMFNDETDEIRFFLPTRDRARALALGPIPFFRPPLTGPEIAMLLAMVLSVVGLTGFLLAAPLARRLKRLENAITELSRGGLAARVTMTGTGPVTDLARRFNEMAARIQALVESERHLLQAVSHELRTPISRLRFSLEMLATVHTPDEHRVRLREIDEDLTELDALVGELLVFARFDSATQPIAPKAFGLRDTLEALLADLLPQRSDLVIELQGPGAADVVVEADPKLFTRAVRNLLSNAIRFANGRVWVSWAVVPEGTEVEVCDDGPGIPEAERARVLEPFARLDDCRSRQSGGAGLGLAIVQRIVAAHGGRLQITDAPGGGARLVSLWPRRA